MLYKSITKFFTIAIVAGFSLAGCTSVTDISQLDAETLIIATTEQPISNRYADIVVNVKSNNILHKTNANKPRYPASLTKLMTLYLVFEAIENEEIRIYEEIKVSNNAARQPRSKLGLIPESNITVKNAVNALAIQSANDVAVAVAEHMAGNERVFAQRMTKKARELGMNETRFFNASGLHHPRQITTANDMIKLALAIKRDFPQHYHYFSKRDFKWNGRKYKNKNEMLKRLNGATGLKTGFVRTSGYNLAATADRGGVELVAVVMGELTSRSRTKTMLKLMNEYLPEK